MSRPVEFTKTIDKAGRVVIPLPLRKILNLDMDDTIEFTIGENGKTIILKKRSSECFKCGDKENTVEISDGYFLCKKCLKKLND